MLAFDQLCHSYGIGLTGGIATGKSTIAKLLAAEGFVVIDADRLSRVLVEPGTEGLAAVVQRFGLDCLDPQGRLDRARMRRLIFSDPQAREDLEAIIHPRLTQACWEALRQKGLPEFPRPWFYEASLIFERQREGHFREVWASYCPRSVQLARVQKRDGISREEAEAILNAQLPAEEKARRARLVIDSDCDSEELVQRVKAALSQQGLRSDQGLKQGGSL